MRDVLTLRNALLALTCCAQLAAAAVYGDTPKIQLDIPAGDLSVALNALAKQSGADLVYRSDQVRGLRTPGVRGELSTEEAINELLKGTPLSLNRESSGAMIIAAPKDSVHLSQSSSSDSPEVKDPNKGDSSKEEDPKKIEEVVVTAQKREQSLQDVPISIAVLDGDKLDASTYANVQDALETVPSVDIGQSGEAGGALLSIRGVANGNNVFGGSSTVAYYLDGISYGRARSSIVPLDADTYDLERIEVLRGPQGTLYGASSLNGVVRVLTRNPNTREFELKSRAYVSSTEHGGWNYGGNVAVNVPLVKDKLAIRAAIGFRDDPGWIDSPVDKNGNISKLQSYRVKLRAEPTETLTINLSAWHSESDQGDPNLSDSNYHITSVEDQWQSITYDVFGAEIVKDFGPFSVSSMTSYMDARTTGKLDGTPVGVTLVIDHTMKSKIFTEELNIVSQHEGPWRWSAGAFYREGKDHMFTIRDWLGFFETLFGDKTIHEDYQDTSKSFAVYGEVGRRFLDDKLELSAGLRYFRDRQSLENFQSTAAPARSTAKAPTPRAVLTWSPTPRNSFYTSYSQGFRSGLLQAPNIQAVAPNFVAAEPDKLHNYEIGAKGSILNGVLSYEGALYYIDWQKVQQPVRVVLTADPQGNPQLVGQAVINAGSASGPGAEFAVTVRPAEGLQLGAQFSWNNLKFDNDVVETGGGILFPKNGRLVLSPKYTAGASASYTFSLGGDLTGALSLSGNYKSPRTNYYQVAGQYGPIDGPKRFDGGNASFSIAAKDRWTARLFVDNLTDNYASTEPIAPFPEDASSFEWRFRYRPRTIGMQLELHY